MLGKLHNSLLEMVAVIGIDETVALVPADPELHCDQFTDLTSKALSPQILAAVSSHVALFPPVSQRPDSTYPPQIRRSPSSAEPVQKKSQLGLQTNDKVIRSKGSKLGHLDGIAVLKRRLTKRFSCRQVDFASTSDKKTIVKSTELPLNVETLTSLMTLGFPDDCFINISGCPDNVRYLVLTDIVGTRTYAVSLCCYTRHHIYKDADGLWRCSPLPFQSSPNQDQDPEKRTAYIPQCYIFISQNPYFTVMKDCLSRLVLRLKENREDWRRLLKEFALQLSMTPVPPPGCVFAQFQLYDVLITVPASDGHGRMPVDFNLGLVFRCLDAQTVLLILTAIMTQQRLLFMSSNYVLLTLVMESFIHFLHPFRWNFTYVPLLPLSLLELVEAPGTFLMGCHSRHRQLVEDVEGLVVINLDNGTALPCPSVDISTLPLDSVKIFKDAIRRTISPVEPWRLESPSTFTYEETRLLELKQQQKMNAELSTIFLELMVNLFRNVLLHISPEKRFFHREQFLEAVSESDRPFYEQVLSTDLFAVFLKERLDKKQDLWLDFVVRNRPLSRGSVVGTSMQSNERPWIRPSLSRNAFSLTNIASSLTEFERVSQEPTTWVSLKLPNFMYGLSHLYLDNCYQEVSSAVTTCQPATNELSTYLYLRGMLSAARNKRLMALEDFCSLATVNHRLFPIEFVLELLSSMSESQRLELESSTLYQTSAILREVQALKMTQQFQAEEPIVMELNKIPEKDIDLQWFTELLEMLQICSDSDTAGRLFSALTLNHSDVVDPVTFEEFYKCWKENEVQIHRATPHFKTFKCVLKISDRVKCCFGMGHILLTKNRLLYAEEGFSKLCKIVDFVDVRGIEKFQQRTFFKEQWTIKIQRTDKREKSFTVSFREDTHKWYLLLHEMWSGKLLSEETKDPSMLHLAMQNVLIINAYLCSGEVEICSHYKECLQMSPSLCYFMAKKTSLVTEANELLVKRLDPNAFQSKRFAVESVLYADAYGGKNNADPEIISARIFCGMGSGKIDVFDVDPPLLEHHLFLSQNKITCLLQCQAGEIWAGSWDQAIYIIANLTQISCNHVLPGHMEGVVDMTVSTDIRFIYSVDASGKIIEWNAETRARIRDLQVLKGVPSQILYNKDRLWCCTRDELLSMSCDGTVLARVSFPEPGSSHLECFAITSRNEVWIGCERRGRVHICDAETLQPKTTFSILGRGVGFIVCVQNKVWIGSKQGVIHIFDRDTYSLDSELTAHMDAIRSVSVNAEQQLVVTASGSLDGKVAIWRWQAKDSTIDWTFT